MKTEVIFIKISMIKTPTANKMYIIPTGLRTNNILEEFFLVEEIIYISWRHLKSSSLDTLRCYSHLFSLHFSL